MKDSNWALPEGKADLPLRTTKPNTIFQRLFKKKNIGANNKNTIKSGGGGGRVGNQHIQNKFMIFLRVYKHFLTINKQKSVS